MEVNNFANVASKIRWEQEYLIYCDVHDLLLVVPQNVIMKYIISPGLEGNELTIVFERWFRDVLKQSFGKELNFQRIGTLYDLN